MSCSYSLTLRAAYRVMAWSSPRSSSGAPAIASRAAASTYRARATASCGAYAAKPRARASCSLRFPIVASCPRGSRYRRVLSLGGARTDDLHGARRMPDHGFGDAAQHPALDPGPPMGTEHDEIGLPVLRVSEDAVSGVSEHRLALGSKA